MKPQVRLWSLICFLFVIACQTGQQKSNEKAGEILPAPDTFNAGNTYLKLKDKDPATIDTAYARLFACLNDSNRYALLHEHVQYYQKLRGTQGHAAALISKCEGFSYNYASAYDSSKQFYRKAIAWYEQHHVLPDLAECYYGQAMNYFFEGNYAEALALNYKAVGIYEQVKDSTRAFMAKN